MAAELDKTPAFAHMARSVLTRLDRPGEGNDDLSAMNAHHPPIARSGIAAKSPYLHPVAEDFDLRDEDIFSLDSKHLVDEPFSLDGSEASSEDEDDERPEEPVHVEGVPRSEQRFEAKRYTTPEFAKQLLILLREELHLPGWCDLPPTIDPAGLSISKVSGALTNAVFFVSCPVPDSIAPPTVLVRVYGPASDSLLSLSSTRPVSTDVGLTCVQRRLELHILHTLSAEYHFGPHILGTFANGRVEEYFESTALNKHLIREPKLSCWIARRMKELHNVNPDLMRLPDHQSTAKKRPVMNHRNSSNISLLSTSSSSSVFSFGSSVSTSSLGAKGRTPSRGSSMSSSVPRSGIAEVPAAIKRRSSHIHLGAPLPKRKHSSDSLGVWLNLSCWTREGSRVLKMAERVTAKLAHQNGIHLDGRGSPLSSPAAFKQYVAELDLPRFEHEVKVYRAWVSKWEKQHGRAKRVFAHNDSQYGNILLRSGLEADPVRDSQSAMSEVGLARPHELLIVIDFEYAALNPRGFDVANHFIEWKADYHSAESHALQGAYPSWPERRRFYRAYVGCDNGDDTQRFAADEAKEEDPRVLRLEEEVRVWTPASHAMWTVWALVQARDQVQAKCDEWLSRPPRPESESRAETQMTPPSTTRPHLERGKSGEGDDGDDEFEYLLYASGRLAQFRQLLADLHVV